MRQPAAVLIDLDGTLVDSASGILATYNATLLELGHEPDPDFDMTFAIGPVLADIMPVVLAHYDETRVNEAIVLYRHFYGQGRLFDLALYPGITRLLQALSAASCQVFLITAKRLEFADRILQHLGLANCFDGIYGSVPDGSLDHKKALIATVLAENAIDPADAIMVGDRRHDIAGAHANNVRAFGVLWGYGTMGELVQAGADELAGTPVELEALLLGSHIRTAAYADLADLMALYASFPSHDPNFDARTASTAWAAIQSTPGLSVIVAEHEGRVVSTCTLMIVPNLTMHGRPWAVIDNVVTHPEMRQQRLATRVLAYATARAWEAGCYKVSLASGPGLEATSTLCEAAGFKRGAKTYFEKRHP